jgi:myosin heavy subunit
VSLQTDAEDARDALCKAIYEKLFSWIFKRVNELLGPKSKSMYVFVDSLSQSIIS